MIVRGLLDVFIFYRELDDPETEGKFFVADAEKIFKKEIVYACEGFLSDNPSLAYYCKKPYKVDPDTKFEWFRCFATDAGDAHGSGARVEVGRPTAAGW